MIFSEVRLAYDRWKIKHLILDFQIISYETVDLFGDL